MCRLAFTTRKVCDIQRHGSNPKFLWSKSKRIFAMDISHYSQNTLGQNPHGLKYFWIRNFMSPGFEKKVSCGHNPFWEIRPSYYFTEGINESIRSNDKQYSQMGRKY